MRPRPLRLFSTVPIVCLLTLLGFPEDGRLGQPSRASDRTESVHLILDLGSSGTRFCMYPVSVERTDQSSDRKRCRVSSPNPVCVKMSGGIAALVRGHSAEEVPSMVLPKLRQAWDALGDAHKKGNPQLRERIQGVVALGTGGFRNPSTNLPDERREFQAVWAEIARFFKDEVKQQHVVARTISGLDEARLAWLGVSQQVPASVGDSFAIIEVGGASIQFATSGRSLDYQDLYAASEYRGQDYVFHKFAPPNGPTALGFDACFSPEDRSRQDGPACMAFLRANVFSGSSINQLAYHFPPRRLYGLGAPWLGIFSDYPSAPPWPPKLDTSYSPKLSPGNLARLAEKVCKLSDEEIGSFAPNAFDLRKNSATGESSGKACFTLSYHAGFLESVAMISQDAALLPGGDDQWARGAAVTHEFFPDC
ncbi:MAG: hypothetical protein JNM40_03515 [Myxococcales bacterium]|nr:hypothetical protein [Myxococcales bacterium]